VKVAVLHHSLNISGGAEKLCLDTIDALKRRGHQVTLVTVERTDWNLLQNKFGPAVMPDKEYSIMESRFSSNLASIPIASTYFLIYTLLLFYSRIGGKHDLTLSTFGDVVHSFTDITYIHFPLQAALEFAQIPAFSHASMWHRIAPLYDRTMSILDRSAPSKLLLTNSKFMQRVIRKTVRRDALVVYPPVNTKIFSSKCSKTRKEKSLVAVVASYTPKRHLEQLPKIAQHTKTAKYVVIGKNDKYSSPTMRELRRQMHLHNVEDRITLLENVPFNELQELLARAKVYLHTMPFDHFGISLVEAMASGCVPVVHQSGGPWMDILNAEQGKYGFSYLTSLEAAEYIDTLIADEDLRGEIAAKASYRSKEFDMSVFIRRLAQVVEKFADG
jgi:alpha-1,2-mannosyltransferase